MKFARKILEAVFPDKFNCVRCGKELAAPARDGLCPSCEKILPRNDGDICVKCGRRIGNEADYCLTCQNRDRHFARARSVCLYKGVAKELILKLKFGNRRYLAKYLANRMTDLYLDEELCCDLVAAVPMTDKSRRRRGYNQAELLARRIAEQLKLPYSDALRKVRETEEQARMRGAEREKNVADAFRVADRGAVDKRRVLLVDDVLTTGATAGEAAKALLKAGAKEISVLTFCSTEYIIQTETGGVVYEQDEMV